MLRGKPVYRRALLKLSGEALLGSQAFGIDPEVVGFVAEEIRSAVVLGVQLGVVIGGGNIFRGIDAGTRGIDRTTADYMGMLATIINSLALQSALERCGVPTRVLTSIEMRAVAEPFIQRRAIRHLEKGRTVIFGGGTGNPFFTTDTAASLRAVEIQAEVMMKATKVDGVYDQDPMRDDSAVMYDNICYNEVLAKDLKVMDATAISLCRENRLPILVFNLLKSGSIRRAVCGEKIGTIVQE